MIHDPGIIRRVSLNMDILERLVSGISTPALEIAATDLIQRLSLKVRNLAIAGRKSHGKEEEGSFVGGPVEDLPQKPHR